MSDIRLEGLEEVLGALDDLADTSNLNAALGKACALVERSAKQKAPKDKGDLRRSITSKVEGTEGVVYTPLEYAPYVEYGTKKLKVLYVNPEGKLKQVFMAEI